MVVQVRSTLQCESLAVSRQLPQPAVGGILPGHLMLTRKNQAPPDLRDFKQIQNEGQSWHDPGAMTGPSMLANNQGRSPGSAGEASKV
jgi:hypothetical protein